MAAMPTTTTEGALFTEEEREILARVEATVAAEDFACWDARWKDRLIRGMWTNNRGDAAKRWKETVEAFERIAKWRREQEIDSILERRLRGFEEVMRHVQSTAGGRDDAGHVVWVERLVEVGALVDGDLTTAEILAVRAQATEAMERLKSDDRYKAVYVLDLSVLALMPLLRRADVRKLTLEIMGLGTFYYPEGIWKLYVVNAPLVFRSVYAVVAPFIHPVTKNKIKILGGPKAYLAEMARAGLPATSVPALLGGQHPGLPIRDVVLRQLASVEPSPASESQQAPEQQAPPPSHEETPASEEDAPQRQAAATSSAPQPKKKKKKGGFFSCCAAGDDVDEAATTRFFSTEDDEVERPQKTPPPAEDEAKQHRDVAPPPETETRAPRPPPPEQPEDTSRQLVAAQQPRSLAPLLAKAGGGLSMVLFLVWFTFY